MRALFGGILVGTSLGLASCAINNWILFFVIVLGLLGFGLLSSDPVMRSKFIDVDQPPPKKG